MIKQLLFCLLLLPLCTNAQQAALSFGPLKINVTRLDELEGILGTKLYTYGDPDFKKDERLKELDSNWYAGLGAADVRLKKRFVKGYRIIKLTDCKDGDMELDQLELMFYKGVLIQIVAAVNPKLDEWCIQKWGKPEDNSTYDTVACVNYYDGKKEKNVNTKTLHTWTRNGVEARYYMEYTYDPDCRMKFWSSFVMADSKAILRYEQLRRK